MTVEQKARHDALSEVQMELLKWAGGHTEHGLLEAAKALHEAVEMVGDKIQELFRHEVASSPKLSEFERVYRETGVIQKARLAYGHSEAASRKGRQGLNKRMLGIVTSVNAEAMSG